MHRHFDDELERVTSTLLRMGSMAEDAIHESIQALFDRDSEKAQSVIRRDSEIDRIELEIDQMTVELIAIMQPAASDLRYVVTLMKVTPELERIADLAQDACERALELNREPLLRTRTDMQLMARTAQEMVRESLNAFVRRDADLAREIIDRDDVVDELMEEAFHELLASMQNDPATVPSAIRLTFIAKYFERIADAATNICEMVVYLVEGKVIKHAGAV